jgi:hypothetical protein
MKLLIDGIHGGECVRNITDALLGVDLGARINFNLDAHLVRIEGRLSVDDARTAIERGGFRVACVVDDTVMDTMFRVGRREAAFG